MTFKAFFRIRRQQRLQRRADRAMHRIFGAAWDANKDGVYDLLTAPTPVYAVDAVALDAVVRRIVADELAAGSAAAEVEEFGETFEDEALDEFEVNTGSNGETAPVGAIPDFEPVEKQSVESNGVEAAPVRPDLNNDEKRRAFIANFLNEQRAVRGPVIPTR